MDDNSLKACRAPKMTLCQRLGRIWNEAERRAGRLNSFILPSSKTTTRFAVLAPKLVFVTPTRASILGA